MTLISLKFICSIPPFLFFVLVYFPSVTTGNYGEYVDTNEFRPLSGLGKAGKGGYEERDPYKFKDRQGRTVLCHYCNEPANAQTRRRIVACDFCELHWHLDCVDPPLVGMPPITRRFMCPAHADEVIVSHNQSSFAYLSFDVPDNNTFACQIFFRWHLA